MVRCKARDIPRFHGASPILKIGCTKDAGGFYERFSNYNHQDVVTVSVPELVVLLRGGGQTTNVTLMYFLAHWAGDEPVALDLYFAKTSTPAELQARLLEDYLLKHRELPPLNRGRR